MADRARPFRTWNGVAPAEFVDGVTLNAIGGEQVLLCRVSYEPGKKVPLHKHDDTEQVMVVVDGSVDARSEYVVRVTGTVRARPAGTVNPHLATGEIEIGDCTVEVLSAAEPPPFPIDARADNVDETVRLHFRYLDLRRERMQRNLRIRSQVNAAIRGAMQRQGFVDLRFRDHVGRQQPDDGVRRPIHQQAPFPCRIHDRGGRTIDV